jgi:hypothetical protein
MINVPAYPLSWPDIFPRTARRERGSFKTSLAGAIKNVQDSLRLFALDSGKKLEGITVSSNVSLGVNRPADPGVAVWFTWDGLQVCIPVDRYETVEGNLQAIHHILEARRVEMRHGTLALVRASMQGFLALPAPGTTKSWREVLGVDGMGHEVFARNVDDVVRELSLIGGQLEDYELGIRKPPTSPAKPDSEGQAVAWTPLNSAGQIQAGDFIRFNIGEAEFVERAAEILNSGSADEEVVYNKKRNYYFITSMALDGSSNHKNIQVLSNKLDKSGIEGGE